MPLTVKLSTLIGDGPLLARQTPGWSSSWGDCRFAINRPIERCDGWVVFEDLPQPELVVCPPRNTILITGEPPSINSYHPRFLAQFGLIVTCQPDLEHPHVLRCQQASPWHFGLQRSDKPAGVVQRNAAAYDYDALARMMSFPKEKLMSVVCSSKSFTPGHRRRLEFVEMLRHHFGARVSHFGAGFQVVADKAQAILPYRYHVALENCSVRDYWTEKLADVYLGGAYPFYYGCPNLADYFPAEAFTMIDINDPERALATIEEAIKNDYYDKRQAAVAAARSLVLDKYNLFAVAHDLCTNMPVDSPKPVTIQPASSFTPRPSLLTRATRFSSRLLKQLSRGGVDD
jgi:Glycosyltransferase family 10 (fucosyltransferase) C-term